MRDAFRAPPWLRHAHLQTTFPALLRPMPLLARRRERLELADGDFVDLDWLDDDAGDPAHARPLVIVLHGLAGSTNSIYVVAIQKALQARGISSIAMNFRGAGGIPNRLARTYHAGDTGDLDALARMLRTRFPARPLAAIGYSLGGNVLLKWLGESGNNPVLVAGCAVSAPIDLAACSAQLDRGLSRIYRNRLRDELVDNLVAKQVVLGGNDANGSNSEARKLQDLGNLRDIRTFREYDDRVIAPLHGFRDAADYYARSSARQFLRAIAAPTLVIHALDDPFMTPSVAPTEKDVSASVQLAVSAQGGHVGFVNGNPWRPRYWLEEVIPEFLDTAFSR